MPRDVAMARNTVLSAAAAHGRRRVDTSDLGPGGEGRAVRVPAHHHAVAERGVGGGGDRVTDLVRRRAESTAETAGASVVVAGRWIVCAERTNHVW